MENFNNEIINRINRLKPRVDQNKKSRLESEIPDRSAIPAPGFCCLGVVDTCMLKCRMCNKWKTDLYVKDKRKPTIAQWKRVISQLRDLTDGPFEIDFGGGEALMMPSLLELVRHASDLGFTTTIASNGWLIDDDMAKRISDARLSKIILSLDSMNQAIHDELRGVPGTHARVMRAIDALYRHRYSKEFIIGICSIVMEKTIDGILDLYDWASTDQRISHILYMAVMQPNNSFDRFSNDWYSKSQFDGLWPTDKDKINRIFARLSEHRRAGYHISNAPHQIEAHRRYFLSPKDFVKTSPCNMDTALHVSAVGDVFLCFKWDILGNIIDEDCDVRKIWSSKNAKNVRKKINSCQDNCHFLLNCYFEKDYPFEEKKKA